MHEAKRTLALDHLRFVTVLGQLRYLARRNDTSAADCPARRADELGLAVLFDSENSDLDLDEASWVKWFGESGGESAFPTVYGCQPFYGVVATGNLLQRFRRLLFQPATPSGKRRGRTDGDHDVHVHAWGRYARDLVTHNGGWQRFVSHTTLSDVADLWPGGKSQFGLTAHDRHSFVSRVLHLYEHRYIQVCTATVGMLWPLWALKTPTAAMLDMSREGTTSQRNERTRTPSKSSQRTDNRPAMPIFVEVLTRVGEMASCPYPFGIADQAAIKANREFEGAPWSQETVVAALREINTFYWSPPVLFSTRLDSLSKHPEFDGTNKPISFIKVAESCPIFSTVYRRERTALNNGSPRPLQESTLSFEIGTWAESLAPFFGKVKRKSRTQVMSRPDEDVDFVALYFPGDLVVRVDPEFPRLKQRDLIAYGVPEGTLQPVFPATVLVGGQLLAKQSKGVTLLIDLSLLLQRVHETVDSLLPNNRETLENSLQSFDDAGQEERDRSVDILRRLYDSNIPASSAVAPSQLFSEIADCMADILAAGEADAAKQRAVSDFRKFGWAALLRYVRYTSVYISCDLFRH